MNPQLLVADIAFAEAPRWHNDALYISDMHGHRILRIATDNGSAGTYEVVATFDGPVSGLGWLPDGRMLVVSMNDRRVLRQEQDGRFVVHADLHGVATWHANDMVVDAHGISYVGNFGFSLHPREEARSTQLARVTPDGEVFAEGKELSFPNGMAITPDGRTLIVAETTAARLTAFDIGTGGALSRQRLWAGLGKDGHPDGICLDAEGAVWAALPRAKKFIRVREGGEVVNVIEVDDMALACVLGGSDLRSLFLCSSADVDPQVCPHARSASVRVARVAVPGAGVP